jgi:Zn-dependent alcohol dehydrogenase
MRAAVVRKPGTIEIEQIDRPRPGPGEVLVKVVATGVCRSDLSAFLGKVPVPLPVVLGHEGAGIVEELGAGVDDLEPGDHVVMSITPGCGMCFQCQSGSFGLCERAAGRSIGGVLANGAIRISKGDEQLHHFLFQSSFAEYAVIARWSAVKIDSDLSLEVASLVACGVITAYGAVARKAKVGLGESVLVIGAGGVGLSVIMTAAASGASPIICADTKPEACALAMELGATHTVVVGPDVDLPSIVMDLTGHGVDHAFDVVGTSPTITTAFNCLRAGGQAVAIGLSETTAVGSISLQGLIAERRLTGTTNGSIRPQVDIPAVLRLYREGRFPLDHLITRRYSLEGVGDALGDLEGGTGRGMIFL